MLNIVLQCSALFMLVVLLGMFIQYSGLNISGRRRYFHALLASILCLCLDIASIFGIDAAVNGSFPDIAAVVICKLYVMSLILQAYLGFLYAAGEFFAGGSHKALRHFYSVWFVVGIVLIGVLPIYYLIDGRVVYSYGPSTIATYIFAVVFIMSTISMAFFSGDRTSRNRRRAILIWQGVWLLAAVIQFVNAELLLVGFANALGMMILYAELENPQDGIDRSTGLYTANALMDYVNDAAISRKSFAAVYINIEPAVKNMDYETKRMMFVRTANFFKASANYFPFRYTDTEIVLAFEKKKNLDNELSRIRDGLGDAIGLRARISRIILRDSTALLSLEEFTRIPYFFQPDLEITDEIELDDDAIDRLREYDRVNDLIKSALAEERVEVFYQPFYNVKQKAFTAAEALVRIRDRDGSVVPPGKFIPISEENGMIIPLGIEIFRQVCEFLSSKKPERLGIRHIEVNLSMAQFDDDNPATFVMDLIKEYGVAPPSINLEITETASPNTKRVLLKNMNKLIETGVTFSLDDFGTGRSNLDYFVEMPVSIIKFDYTFTQNYFKSEKARIVMESMISFMHRMGMKIVSEGVETKEQFEAMCAIGVEYIQGFYFSKPLPEDEFIEFVSAHLDGVM